ncbi:hypothetical protein ACW9UR_10540 [Halovulum sp. GXIMD14794]
MKMLLSSAAVLLIATGAYANDQMARSMGLEPGVYSDAELIQIRAAMDADDDYRLHQLLDKDTAVISTQSVGGSASNAQLARSVGVEPGVYSTAELAQMRAAMDADEDYTPRHVSHDGSIISTQSISATPESRTQLERILGVEGQGLTDAELSYLFIDETS